MDKLYLAGQNLGRVFNFRYGCVGTTCTSYITMKLPNLNWKTRPKHLLDYLPLAFVLPALNKHFHAVVKCVGKSRRLDLERKSGAPLSAPLG
jgi:hypothetical protein